MNKTDEIRPVALPIRMLRPFPNHPYQVRDDDAMFALMDSIDTYGVLAPVLVRRGETGYEIISGHRRCHAAKAVGLGYVPAIVCDLSRDEAAILLVDSNLHREHLLPSEKAFAYKMKMDALKHQGKRSEATCGQLGHTSRDCVSDEESGRTIQRYIRLTHLIPELLGYMDRDEMALSVGVELSYLSEEAQYALLDAMAAEDCTPSYSQAVRMRNLFRCGDLDEKAIGEIMAEPKANQRERVSLSARDLRRFFPPAYTAQDMEQSILRMLEERTEAQQERPTHEAER
jgi:ParB-like partition proteins